MLTATVFFGGFFVPTLKRKSAKPLKSNSKCMKYQVLFSVMSWTRTPRNEDLFDSIIQVFETEHTFKAENKNQ